MCRHHIYNFYPWRGSYECCGGNRYSQPCRVRDFHVTEDIDPNKLFGFIDSEIDGLEQRRAAYVVDCEFVYTKAGQELASIIMLDMNENVVWNAKVATETPIIDYLTEFSGLT